MYIFFVVSQPYLHHVGFHVLFNVSKFYMPYVGFYVILMCQVGFYVLFFFVPQNPCNSVAGYLLPKFQTLYLNKLLYNTILRDYLNQKKKSLILTILYSKANVDLFKT